MSNPPPQQDPQAPGAAGAAAFIARWSASQAAERANYQLFLSELCDLLGVPRPDPARPDDRDNAYVFERAVPLDNGDGSRTTGFIDLYKRAAFVLEAKQGSQAAADSAELLPGLADSGVKVKSKKGTAVRGTAGVDVAMAKAKAQGERYVRALPAAEGNPPFLIVVDVGHTIELYAEFARLGKNYTPFPDSTSFRLRMADLANSEVRKRLAAVWIDPLSLDPARRSAKVTRQVAERLALLARSLESAGHSPETVAEFLMRCLFTFFAEDVKLMRKEGGDSTAAEDRPFTALLETLRDDPVQFPHLVEQVWKEMKTGGFSVVLRRRLLHFNGGLFEHTDAPPLNREQLELLIDAARADWSDVEPAIFGTLLERALDVREREKLGAHYTPRAYVERLVLPAVIEPLREAFDAAKAAAFKLTFEGKPDEARKALRDFLVELCRTTVLDPACGSGNFLYVTMDHMKRLEGEVHDALQQLGEDRPLEYVGLTVDPHQFLGLEVNPRAVKIADLVLWIGFLQWHFRTHGNTPPATPVLKKFGNIREQDAVLAYDAKEMVRDEQGKPVSRWDGRTMKVSPVTGEEVPEETARVPVYRYVNPRKAEWPKADFVVGNPPFIGGWKIRGALGDGYVEALWNAYPDIPEKADYVMYWWDRAAEAAGAGAIRRFGLITTNSITQVFQRRVIARHLATAPQSVRILFAISDHPWVDDTDAANVRVALTVAERSVAAQLHPARLGHVRDFETAIEPVVDFEEVAK